MLGRQRQRESESERARGHGVPGAYPLCECPCCAVVLQLYHPIYHLTSTRHCQATPERTPHVHRTYSSDDFVAPLAAFPCLRPYQACNFNHKLNGGLRCFILFWAREEFCMRQLRCLGSKHLSNRSTWHRGGQSVYMTMHAGRCATLSQTFYSVAKQRTDTESRNTAVLTRL